VKYTLHQVLAQLPARDAKRIENAVRLINRQAIGSERYRTHVESWSKDDKSPVTVADLLHQTQVQQMIAGHFPTDGLISEEPRDMQEKVLDEAVKISEEFYGQIIKPEIAHVPESGDVTWILDPIDGTKGYLAGRYYAIAIGYFREGLPHFGAMAVPHASRAETNAIDNSIAFAVAGHGAWIGSVVEDGELMFEALKTQRDDLKPPFRVAVSLEHAGALGKAVESGELEAVKLDSQAKYLAVAANVLDAYLRQSRDDGGIDQTWDHMPGALIALEAGCTVSSFDGSVVRIEASPTIRFNGGMMCHRGRPDGPVGNAVRSLLDSR